MSAPLLDRLRDGGRRFGPWLVLPLVAVLAFLTGRCAGGEATGGTGDPAGDGGGAPGQAGAQDPTGGPAGTSRSETSQWTCSMHPQVRREEPGPCPICGMDLVPVAQLEDDGGAGGDDGGGEPRITLSERARALARIRTTEVRRARSPRVTRPLLGRLVPDEGTRQTVTAWVGGRIDRLRVDVTGERVRRGQVVADVYSPEVYAAQQELLAAVAQAERLGPAAARGVDGAGGSAALAAARRRLALLGLPEGEIDRMARAETPAQRVPVRSPFAGTVLRRRAAEGAWVAVGAPLYELADLRRLWLELDAYERDLPLLSVGDPVVFEVQALPGESFEGRITFIEPTIDAASRAARLRVEVENDRGLLRPGMFVEAVVAGATPEGSGATVPGADLGEGNASSPLPDDGETAPLVIPASAPLYTGRRSVVYVEVPNASAPTYELRVVRVGPETTAGVPVLAGLSPGERVVTHGAFVLDADLQIRRGLGMMALPDDRQRPGPWAPVVAEVAPPVRRALGEVVDTYLAVQEALAGDDLPAARDAAADSDGAIDRVPPPADEAARARWETIARDLAAHGARIAQAPGLEEARAAFAGLSRAITLLLQSFGNPLSTPLHLAHCPMAFGDEGGDWVQRGVDVENAYFGEEMFTCGAIRARIDPGARLPAAAASSGGEGRPTTPGSPPMSSESHVH